jgi:hypothetical protein
MSVIAHLTEPVHNTVAHTLDSPIVATIVLAAIVITTIVVWRIARRRTSRDD